MIIAMAAPKGGTGKSTTAIHLATYAAQEGLKVVLLDLDEDSRTSTEWAHMRAKDMPTVIPAWEESPKRLIRMASQEGFDLVVLDTPPRTENAVEASKLADLTQIVVRPAFPDLRPLQRQVAHIRKPFTVLLNSCPPPRGGKETGIVREARELLKTEGIPCCPVTLSIRADYAHALISGEAVTEYREAGKASDEIMNLWQWVKEETWHADH